MTPHGPYAGVVDVARKALPAEPTAEQLGWIKLQGEVL